MVFHKVLFLVLLFILYINDIHNCILNSSTLLFADDTAPLDSNEELEVIGKHLNHDLTIESLKSKKLP